MSTRTKAIKYVLFLLKKKRFRKLLNFLWVYPLWLDFRIRTFFITKLFPKIHYDPYPPFIEIEPTTICPLKCTMCEHTYWHEPPKNMTFEQFKHIVDQFPHLKWLGFTGIGESWVNPEYLEMLKYVSKKSAPIIELVDNFVFIDEEKAEEVIRQGVDIYFISMVGATKETSEKIMVGSNFDKVLANIKKFIELKRKLKSFTPLMNYHYIISKQNIHEALDFLDLVKYLAADEWEVLYTPLLHSFKEVAQFCLLREEFMELKPKLIKKGQELGIKVAFNENVAFEDRPPISDCANWIMPFIFVTGEVVACCTMNEANNRDRQKKYSFGNIFKKSFRDIWYGKEAVKFRKDIIKGVTPEYCKGCPIYKWK